MLKTDAIKGFLDAYTHSDLSDLYHSGMEVQVNAAQDGGERIGGTYMGKKWAGWSDGLQTWKSFRIPFKAMTTPEYEDKPIKWNLEEHAEAIGLTGWDWRALKSRFVAYDFDAIAGHSEKHDKRLTDQELQEVIDAASKIPWVTVRRSTSGSGIHLYVMLNIDDEVANHAEHAALARAILSQMGALSGYNFNSSVDVCGSNMWIWGRKMRGTDGLTVIKRGSDLCKSPPNWRDHIDVAKGSKHRAINCKIKEAGAGGSFEDLCSSRSIIKLDNEHRKLIKWLEEHDAMWSWDQGNNMITTHVYRLKQAHEELKFKGFFNTLSTGSNLNEQNCFAYPLRGGAWVVRRFSPGCAEHETWDQDGRGWTRSYLNKEADLRMACRAYNGIEDAKGGFFFDSTDKAIKAAHLLNVRLQVDEHMLYRSCYLRPHKDGRLIIEIERQPNDSADLVPGFLSSKAKLWQKITDAKLTTVKEVEADSIDDTVRHIVSKGDDSLGWMLDCDGTWISEPIGHIEKFLTAQGYKVQEIKNMLGQSVARPWCIVNKPFQPEYPGGREWNRKAAQLKYAASTSDYPRFPTWEKILDHCGEGLTDGVLENKWCRSYGIRTGGEYLMHWIAAMIQQPEEPLPYLFFYSKSQNTGKSTFHEALGSILTKGYIGAGAAITSSGGFNKELEGSVLCYIEEIDLASNKAAYNRIKEWVTSKQITIHEKGSTPYQTTNTTHWCQMANSISHCPVFAGDKRIVVASVSSISDEEELVKSELMSRVIKEAPDFLQALQSLEIPPPVGRLRIPVIETKEKTLAEDKSKSELDSYLAVSCKQINGSSIKFSEFYDRFIASLSDSEALKWSKNKVSRELDLPFVTGRTVGTFERTIGNIAWEHSNVEPSDKITLEGVNLVKNGERYDPRQ